MSTHAHCASARGIPSQRGLTLIELMLTLLVSSLLIGMIFAIYLRMSLAYRGQSAVSELQQSLRAAKEVIARDIRSSGFLMPGGVQIDPAVDTLGISMPGLGTHPVLPPLGVQNNVDFGGLTDPLRAAKPDVIWMFYADSSAVARVDGTPLPSATSPTSVTVDNTDRFVPGNLAIAVKPLVMPPTPPPPAPKPTQDYDACLIRITGVPVTGAGGTLAFDATGAPFNTATNTHCTDRNGSPIIDSATLIYRFVGRAYRIDPRATRRDFGFLQRWRFQDQALTDTPALPATHDDWEDLAMGFTDLQLAVRAHQEIDTNGDLDTDADGDGADDDNGDALRDWYSGSVPPPASAPGNKTEITEVRVSLAVRTTRDANVVPSVRTPRFVQVDDAGNPENPNHNPYGDAPSVQLQGVVDSLRPREYRGTHIYRWIWTRVDLRNTGVGR